MNAMQSMQKESSTSRTGELLNLAAAKAIRYVDQAAERAVAPSSADLATLGKFHEPFPSEPCDPAQVLNQLRSEEHTSELQSHSDLVCRLLLEKKKKNKTSR